MTASVVTGLFSVCFSQDWSLYCTAIISGLRSKNQTNLSNRQSVGLIKVGEYPKQCSFLKLLYDLRFNFCE